MDFFGALALILLTLVGYSCGAVIAGREKNKPLGLFDFGMAVLILALALATRPILGRWLATAIWFILAGLGSALLRKVRYKDRRTEDRASPTAAEKRLLRRTWNWWKTFATEMGNYQGRLLFAFFYFIAVTPFGIGVRLFSDPLKVRHRGGTTFWLERTPLSQELASAREQS
jgi:hypothetical protein